MIEKKKIEILESNPVGDFIFQKEILITGGAGSIGSELVRQVAFFSPKKIVVVDKSETPLYQVETEFREKFPNIEAHFILGDITNFERMKMIFEKFSFSLVYHAAAYKQLPLVEKNPSEGVWVNVGGTKNIALLSQEYQVEKFIMISTDKAVNPSSVMGASKRTAELLIKFLQSKNQYQTQFVITRFGNVLGSNGSVVEYFQKQIDQKLPIKITHPEMVRYFMTIVQACELVLHAGVMGKEAEIYIFDMGKEIKILDLAQKMIQKSGYQPNVEIPIVFSGLREGEKLKEELWTKGAENSITSHSKIMISKEIVQDLTFIEEKISEMISLALSYDDFAVVKKLKEIVKEFKSQHSIYEILD